MSNREQGAWVQKLIVRFMVNEAIPPDGGFRDGLEFLLDHRRVARTARQAKQQAFRAIDAVKAARDNQFGDDDEAIARAILVEYERKLRSQHRAEL